ncbi:Ubiquitin-associated/translation elongation factor EF1B N-terminal [Perkinsela sp. CCAP 1560/4]|nr:Ubiquitin-associated/translation elongation factor EF1B N-terminal [Perkinsela sp. CCAP 1560/4]|eukprot:KNH08370.1 Ubiquitin-associated/translation elongation factor EF1B N-terminal [Perkinsela sp. CCAP 1560/4]
MVGIKLKTTKEQEKENWIDVNLEWSVSRFKDEIFSQLGFPSIEQRLVYHGRILKDQSVLRELEMKEGDLVILVPHRPQLPRSPPNTDSEAVRDIDSEVAPQAVMSSTADMIQNVSRLIGPAGARELTAYFQNIASNPDSLATLESFRASMPTVIREMERPDLRESLLDILSASSLNPNNGGGNSTPIGNPSAPHLTREEARKAYAVQLTQMMEMGFFDGEENLTLLIRAHGNVEIALSMKLE